MEKMKKISRKLSIPKLGKTHTNKQKLQLTKEQKQQVDKSFDATIRRYGEVIKKLGNT